MKTIIALTLFTLLSKSYAVDMASTEKYDDIYTEDGTYTGKCMLHVDYQDSLFKTVKVIAPYRSTQLYKSLAKIPANLIKVVQEDGIDDLSQADDLTIEQLELNNNSQRTFILFNIGVGGGNGLIKIIEKVGSNYRLVVQIMDGDLEFCDHTVWEN